MCGRFYIASEDETGEINRMIDEAARRQRAIVGECTLAAGEIFPSAVTAALARGKSGQPGAYPMRWGFLVRRDEKRSGLIINTRSETALQKPMFRASMLERRCLLPFSWYFEWDRRGALADAGAETDKDGQTSFDLGGASVPHRQNGRQRGEKSAPVRYAIRPETPGLMFLAGIYRYEKDQPLPAFSILTMPPAPEIAFIHDRMPVIFSAERKAEWLSDSAEPDEMLKKAQMQMSFRIA